MTAKASPPRGGAHCKPGTFHYSVPREKRYAKGIELLLTPAAHRQLLQLTSKLKTRSRTQTVVQLLERATRELAEGKRLEAQQLFHPDEILDHLRGWLEAHKGSSEAGQWIYAYLSGACEHPEVHKKECTLCGASR